MFGSSGAWADRTCVPVHTIAGLVVLLLSYACHTTLADAARLLILEQTQDQRGVTGVMYDNQCSAWTMEWPPQVLMGAIALRREKTMLVGGRPLVELPPRTVSVVKVTLGAEDRAKYNR